MKVAEIRKMSTDDLRERLDENREELMKLRFQQATGELVDYNRLRSTRRDIARFMTVLNQRNMEEAKEGEA
ncbi:MAG: 50S ribosomal protein L29 [Anaerolineales bacterium]|nr:50S ribosomal protein L29 [Anaerolineales bacterium]